MRCDECGRHMTNAELWRLAGTPDAPTSTSMRHLCWECRDKGARADSLDSGATIIREAIEAVRRYEATHA